MAALVDALASLWAAVSLRWELAVWEVPVSPPVAILVASLISLLVVLLSTPKGCLYLWSVVYFFLSSDKSLVEPNDFPVRYSDCRRRKIVFIRHGQSEWNAVFNEGSAILLPVRLLRALMCEALMFFAQDSLFLDSPLSDVGIRQSWELLTFLASQQGRALGKDEAAKPMQDLDVAAVVAMIRGEAGDSVVASSILRRALSTGFFCLSGRLLKSSADKDRFCLMTALQEVSRNVDTLSLTPPLSCPQAPLHEARLPDIGDLASHFYRTRSDCLHNTGNKTLQQVVCKRQDEFCRWAFDRSADLIVVCGHSLWFREFFRRFLPGSSPHVAKDAKLVNCGCVGFDLLLDPNDVLRIAPGSIKEIYGGFESQGEKKKVE